MWVGAKSQKDGGSGEVGVEKYCFLFFSLASNQQQKMDPFCFNSECRQTGVRGEGGRGGGGGCRQAGRGKNKDSDREKREGVGLRRVGHEKKSGGKKKPKKNQVWLFRVSEGRLGCTGKRER